MLHNCLWQTMTPWNTSVEAAEDPEEIITGLSARARPSFQTCFFFLMLRFHVVSPGCKLFLKKNRSAVAKKKEKKKQNFWCFDVCACGCVISLVCQFIPFLSSITRRRCPLKGNDRGEKEILEEASLNECSGTLCNCWIVLSNWIPLASTWGFHRNGNISEWSTVACWRRWAVAAVVRLLCVEMSNVEVASCECKKNTYIFLTSSGGRKET